MALALAINATLSVIVFLTVIIFFVRTIIAQRPRTVAVIPVSGRRVQLRRTSGHQTA